MHNEALRRTPNVVEGVTGYECQHRFACRAQDAYVSGVYDLQPIDYICLNPIGFFHIDVISNLYVLQPSEEAIAVTGDTYVAVLAEERGACDVTDSTI